MTSPQNEPQAAPSAPSADPAPVDSGIGASQDTFRKAYFGQISDPLIPAPLLPSETTEDELTRAALSDPDALKGEVIDPTPTSWRWVFLLLLAVGSLAVLFWKR